MITKQEEFLNIIETIRNKTIQTTVLGLSKFRLNNADLELLYAALSINADFAKSLHELDLSHNRIQNFCFPENLESLKILRLNHNYLSAIRIPSLPSILFIDLGMNQLEYLKLPQSLKTIEEIKLSNNKLSQFILHSYLPVLETLDISSNYLKEFEIFSPLPRLQKLDLHKNQLKHIFIPESSRRLEKININFNPLTSFELPRSFRMLEILSVKGNHFKLATKLGFMQLKTILQKLSITSFTPSIIDNSNILTEPVLQSNFFGSSKRSVTNLLRKPSLLLSCYQANLANLLVLPIAPLPAEIVYNILSYITPTVSYRYKMRLDTFKFAFNDTDTQILIDEYKDSIVDSIKHIIELPYFEKLSKSKRTRQLLRFNEFIRQNSLDAMKIKNIPNNRQLGQFFAFIDKNGFNPQDTLDEAKRNKSRVVTEILEQLLPNQENSSRPKKKIKVS